MKRFLISSIMVCAFLLVFNTACTTIKTVYLQDIEVSGPINNAPIHITDSSKTPSITISPRFYFNTHKSVDGYVDGHTNVNENGVFVVDSIPNSNGTITYQEQEGANRFGFEGNNLTWNFAAVNTGLDVDIKFSNRIAFFAGVNYAARKGKTTMGGNAGIGLFGYNEGYAFRLDMGMNIQSISYDAQNVVAVQSNSIFGSTDEYLLFYRDIGKSTHFDPFINFTFNTANKSWLLNFFINAGYIVQSIVDFEPKRPDPFYYPFPPIFPVSQEITQDLRGESTAGFFNVTPGIYFNLGNTSRVILGSGIYFETQIEKSSSTVFILPMIKVDMLL